MPRCAQRFKTNNQNDDIPWDSEKSDHDDPDCTEVEYLEEADSEGSDNDNGCIKATTYKNSLQIEREHKENPDTNLFDKEFKLTLDDVDCLFLSYAKTFRTFAKQFQSMLKLDLAKLFARYEMKNMMSSSQASNPVVTSTTSQPIIPENDIPSKSFVFVPIKEDNKKIFKRVSFDRVITGLHKSKMKIPPKLQAKPKLNQTQFMPEEQFTQEIRHIPQIRKHKQQDSKISIKQNNSFEDLPSANKPTVHLERHAVNESAPSVKCYKRKKGRPPKIEKSMESIYKTKSQEPDLEMEVSETETVFLSTDHENFDDET